jgi:hypothetical protein
LLENFVGNHQVPAAGRLWSKISGEAAATPNDPQVVLIRSAIRRPVQRGRTGDGDRDVDQSQYLEFTWYRGKCDWSTVLDVLDARRLLAPAPLLLRPSLLHLPPETFTKRQSPSWRCNIDCPEYLSCGPTSMSAG